MDIIKGDIDINCSLNKKTSNLEFTPEELNKHDVILDHEF